MKINSKVRFFFDGVTVPLKDRTALKHQIERLFVSEKRKLKSINYIFCTDQKLLEININYLKHNYYTDIITFNLSENQAIWGEIYISWDRIEENAKIFGVSRISELYRVIFHGALHLCGYKDKSSKEKSKMRKKEQYYLTEYLQ